MGSPMRYQPQGLIRINKNHPLTRQLQFVTVATASPVFQNFVTGQPMTDPFGTDVSFVRSSYSKWGRGRSTAGGSYRNTTTVTPSGVLGKSTLLAVVRPRADTSGTTSTDSFAQAGEGNGGWMTSMLQYGNGNRFSGQCVNGTVLTADTPVTLGECYVVGFTNNGTAGRQALYVNGVKQTATGSYTGNAGKQFDTVTLRALNNFDSGLDILGIFGWSEELTANQMADLSRNPWQLFDAGSGSSAYQSAIIASAAATGGGTTDTGTLTWTEDNDVNSLVSLVTNRASITWVESNDIHSLVTLITDRAVISYQEDNDIHAISASMSGGPSYLAWTEDSDIYAIQGNVSDLGVLLWTEANDTHAMSGQVYNNVTMSWTESDDTSLITGVVTNFGTMSWTEQNDGVLFLPSNSANGSMRRRKGIHK